MKSAPNVGLHVVHLQSSKGFCAVVPHLVGRDPAGVAEFALIIDGPELHAIRLIPTRDPRDFGARDQAIDSLVAGVTASVELLMQLPESPSVSLYVRDEFSPSKRYPSEAVSQKLIHL